MFSKVCSFYLPLRGGELRALRFVLPPIKRITQDSRVLLLRLHRRTTSQNKLICTARFIKTLGCLQALSLLRLILLKPEFGFAVAHDDLGDDLGVSKRDIVQGALSSIKLHLVGSSLVIQRHFVVVLDGPRRNNHR